MTIQRIRPSKRLAGAVIHGNIAYLSGQVSEAPSGKNIGAQTASVLSRIDSLLAEADTDKTKILSATIWLSDMADFAGMNEVWEQWITTETSPARATVEAKLANPEFKVEIQVIAALD